MSEATTTPRSRTAKGWTNADKFDVLFQIITKINQPIPWSQIELPEGRTLKAVQVMVDKEKSKVRKAKGVAATSEDGETPATPIPATPASKGKKRGAKAADTDNEEPKAKKPKTPRKKKVKAGGDREATVTLAKLEAAENNDGDEIKAEPTAEI